MSATGGSERRPYGEPYAPGHRSMQYQIPLPMSTEEYGRAQHYMTGKTAAKEVETGDSGVELLFSEEFDDPAKGGKGIYTEKVYHLQSRLPAIIRKLAPKSAQVLYEYCWNAYPVIRTELCVRILCPTCEHVHTTPSTQRRPHNAVHTTRTTHTTHTHTNTTHTSCTLILFLHCFCTILARSTAYLLLPHRLPR